MVTKQVLHGLVKPRLRHSIIQFFYEEFERLNIDQLYVDLFEILPSKHHGPLLNVYKAHVTKEKALMAYGLAIYSGASQDKARFVAYTVDILWLLSLMFDDIEDADETRSGVITSWKLYGVKECEASMGAAFSVLLWQIEQKLGNSYAQMCQKMVNLGLESIQKHKKLELGTDTRLMLENYSDRSAFHDEFLLYMLFDENYSVGQAGILNALKSLNFAGQILNDVKDFAGEHWYGREGYTDIRSGLITFPVVVLYSKMSDNDRLQFSNLFGSDDPNIDAYIKSMVEKYSLLDDVKKVVQDFYECFIKEMRKIISTEYIQYFELWYAYKHAQASVILT